MTALEVFASVIALLGVVFTARGLTVGWPLGIVGAALYTWIFIKSQLPAEGVLQFIYVLFGAYGWRNWHKEKANTRPFLPVNMSLSVGLKACLLWFPLGCFIGFLLKNFSSGTTPYIDAILAVGGLLATWLMARKYLQNWLFWIAIDLASSVLFFQRELYATSFLYLAFTLLAFLGFFQWRKSMTHEVC